MPDTKTKATSSDNRARRAKLPDYVQRQIFLDIESKDLEHRSAADIVKKKPKIYGNPKEEEDEKRIRAARDRIRFLRSKRKTNPSQYL